MTGWTQLVERHRGSLLGAMMFAILLASVAVAAWLVQLRGGAVDDAVKVLGHIRLRKLTAFWGNDDQTLWYLQRDGEGHPVGWSTAQRSVVEGGYAGRRIRRSGAMLYRERWRIDVAARTGTYSAESFALVRRAGVRVPLLRPIGSTAIALGSGRVTVRRTGPQAAGGATAPAPRNYVPKGLSTLVYFLTAAGQNAAEFTVLLNERALGGNEVHFSRMRVIPQGRQAVRVRYDVPGGSQDEVVELDRQGRILRGGSPRSGMRYEQADFEAVRKAFPEADLFAKPDSPAEDSPEEPEEPEEP